MVVLLVAWCVLGLCAFPLGRVLLRYDAADPIDQFVACTWTGVLTLAALLLGLSFVTPLQPAGAGLIVAAALAGVVLLLRQPHRLSMAQIAAIGFIALGAAATVSGTVGLYDAGLYQLPLIQMLRRYGTLPGAGLLQFRFAFSSSWLAIAAALEPQFLAGRMSPAASGFLTVLATVHFCSALWRIAAGSADRGCWFLAGAYPVVFYDAMLQTSVVSPSPNFAAAFSLVLAGWSWFRESRGNAAIITAALTSLKLTVLPAAVFAALVTRRARRAVLIIAGAIPLLAANYIASGCPAFPAAICLPSPHSLSMDGARAAAAITRNWARFGGPYPLNAGFLEVSWIPGWMARADKLLLAATLSAVIVLFARRRIDAAVGMALAGMLFVFVTAPDTRFLTGYIAILTGCGAAAFARSIPVLPPLVKQPWLWGALGMLVWLSYAVARDIVRPEVAGPGWPSRLIVAAGARSSPTAPWNSRLNTPVSHPIAGEQCWNAAFPCIPYEMDPAARLCEPARGLDGGLCAERVR